jgi:hypothetical protein
MIGDENVQDTKAHGDSYTELFLVLHVQVPEHSPRKKREYEIGGGRVSLMMLVLYRTMRVEQTYRQ